jgi:hypothetical protein
MVAAMKQGSVIVDVCCVDFVRSENSSSCSSWQPKQEVTVRLPYPGSWLSRMESLSSVMRPSMEMS